MAGNRTVYFIAVMMMFQVGQRSGSGEKVQTQISFGPVLGPRRTATDSAVASIEIHRKFSARSSAITDRAVPDKTPRSIDNEFIPVVVSATPLDCLFDIVFAVSRQHGDRNNNFFRNTITHRENGEFLLEYEWQTESGKILWLRISEFGDDRDSIIADLDDLSEFKNHFPYCYENLVLFAQESKQ